MECSSVSANEGESEAQSCMRLMTDHMRTIMKTPRYRRSRKKTADCDVVFRTALGYCYAANAMLMLIAIAIANANANAC